MSHDHDMCHHCGLPRSTCLAYHLLFAALSFALVLGIQALGEAVFR